MKVTERKVLDYIINKKNIIFKVVQVAFLENKICAPRTFMVEVDGTKSEQLSLISRFTKRQVQRGII